MQAFILKHFHLENSQYNRAQNVLNCSPINFLYRRSVLIVFFNVITPLYRPASWCVLILLFIGMVSKKKKCILVLAATAAISFLWFLFLLTLLLVVFDTLYHMNTNNFPFFHKILQFLIILHPVQLQHNLNHTIKMYFANNIMTIVQNQPVFYA